MATRWPTVTPDGVEGTSPDEVRENYVDVPRAQYQALVILVMCCLQARRDMTLPEGLKLALLRVEKEFMP